MFLMLSLVQMVNANKGNRLMKKEQCGNEFMLSGDVLHEENIMVICKNESAYCMMDSAREWRNTIVFYLLV